MASQNFRVQNLYERRPYPHYPLFAQPRWQDGYLGSSLFAQSLFGSVSAPSLDGRRRFLSIGSGEILPYVIRKWEPQSVHLTCVDLSRRSLSRARFRTAFSSKAVEYVVSDINEFLAEDCDPAVRYDHVEAYGVLHHISNFAATAEMIASRMKPGATLRVMVYNQDARQWITDLNRAFQNLGLGYETASDIRKARTILNVAAAISPKLSQRVNQMGRHSLESDTRFADTFLHPWESRSKIGHWINLFHSLGLESVGIFDRYAELDDLPNPLWLCPTVSQLEDRAQDYRYENNLEIWFRKPLEKTQDQLTRLKASSVPWSLRLKLPPTIFDKFSETRSLTLGMRLQIWKFFLAGIHGTEWLVGSDFLLKLPMETRRRLARVGLVLPGLAMKLGIYDDLLECCSRSMDPPKFAESMGATGIGALLQHLMAIQNDPQKVNVAIKRFTRVL